MDPMTLMAIATAGGAGLSFLGGQQANAGTLQGTRDAISANHFEGVINRDFQQNQARITREFQERLASTSHQRQVEDLKKAGLNPILAANAGAATPPGATASGSQAAGAPAPKFDNVFAGATGIVSSAVQAAQMLKGLDRMDLENDLIRAQTGKAKTDTEVARKGIPGAEMTNKVYEILKPMLNKAKDSMDSAAKTWNDVKQKRGQSDNFFGVEVPKPEMRLP